MKRARTLTKKERKKLQCEAKLAREVIDAVKPKPQVKDWFGYAEHYKKPYNTTDDQVDALGFGWAGVDLAQDKKKLRRRRT